MNIQNTFSTKATKKAKLFLSSIILPLFLSFTSAAQEQDNNADSVNIENKTKQADKKNEESSSWAIKKYGSDFMHLNGRFIFKGHFAVVDLKIKFKKEVADSIKNEIEDYYTSNVFTLPEEYKDEIEKARASFEYRNMFLNVYINKDGTNKLQFFTVPERRNTTIQDGVFKANVKDVILELMKAGSIDDIVRKMEAEKQSMQDYNQRVEPGIR